MGTSPNGVLRDGHNPIELNDLRCWFPLVIVPVKTLRIFDPLPKSLKAY